jgi:hypothetical protein
MEIVEFLVKTLGTLESLELRQEVRNHKRHLEPYQLDI